MDANQFQKIVEGWLGQVEAELPSPMEKHPFVHIKENLPRLIEALREKLEAQQPHVGKPLQDQLKQLAGNKPSEVKHGKS